MRIILMSLIASLGLAGAARAECQHEQDTAPITSRIEMIDGKATLVIDKVIVVCGRPARPTVAYVTSPKDVAYSWTQLTEDLTAKIVESVTKLGGRK